MNVKLLLFCDAANKSFWVLYRRKQQQQKTTTRLPLCVEGKFLTFLRILNRTIEMSVKMCDELHFIVKSELKKDCSV